MVDVEDKDRLPGDDELGKSVAILKINDGARKIFKMIDLKKKEESIQYITYENGKHYDFEEL